MKALWHVSLSRKVSSFCRVSVTPKATLDLSRSAFLSVEDGSKSGHGRRGCLEEGAWDAIHVIQVRLLTLSIHTITFTMHVFVSQLQLQAALS